MTYKLSGQWQPLHEALKGGEVRVVEALLAKGAPVNPPIVGKLVSVHHVGQVIPIIENIGHP